MTHYSKQLMSGFTKLFSTIIHSTIWDEDMHVKIVWITMLALADRNGEVQASIPGLAKASGVKLDQCLDALGKLSSPDEYSRTKTNEGRRIAEIDGGWVILNYLKYRERRDQDERRIYIRDAVARHRQKQADVNKSVDVIQSKHNAEAEAEAEADTEAEKIKTIAPSRALAVTYSPEFLEFWNAYPKKTGKGDAWRAWRKASPPLPLVLEALAWQSASEQWNRDGGRYRPNPATYLNQRRWEDEPSNPAAYVPAPTIHGKGNASKAAAERVLAAREAARRANLLS